ncbi:MAG: four-carbon acid sugar kinase family protein [Rhodospirillaceae bacterium]|jgi:3-dehydrotetronate 4-kinase|nr:four-carbon acid sugar kinase family protein [Rhodospirillaceae bacterium]
MTILLGCIADDYTGATDLANTLVRQGMRTVQLFGPPPPGMIVPEAEAVVVALKSRTNPPAEAIAQSLAALEWLQGAGAEQFFFKYCSTFDSTPQGNIGPVAEALLDALKQDFTIACPAFPENGRTICYGYLFVGAQLLSESGMQDHPLTPMTDSSLVRLLAAQTRHDVGLVDHRTVAAGPDQVKAAFAALRAEGKYHAIVDALNDGDLLTIGSACADLKLITGGSGMALGLPENFRRAGKLSLDAVADQLPAVPGPAAVLSGSCSQATLAQVARMGQSRPSFQLDAIKLAAGEDQVGAALNWAIEQLPHGPPLIYASAAPEDVRAAQDRLGRAQAGELLEAAMAGIAKGLVAAGVRRLVVAGGETSGAVVQVLGVTGIRIGPQIDPGVPWTTTLGQPELALALKSGNFGAEDFFLKALDCAP